MNRYLQPIKPSDIAQVKVAKSLLASYIINDNINQPIIDVIPEAASQVNIDVTNWTPAQTRGIWSRIATEWKKRADTAGVLWGTKQGKQSRSSEITARLFTTSGDIISCRPLERIHSSPFPLPILPAQVFILTVASETMATTNGKIAAYINGPLPFKLKISERLVRACIYSSFQRTASVFPGHNQVDIHQFLLAPISLLVPPSPFLVERAEYGRMWPDQSTRIIHDSVSLHTLLASGNSQSDTLVLLAHQSYNIMSWIEWAAHMSKMSPNSSFGIAFVADRDVIFERDRTVYGRHGLDYIIAISNQSLQRLSYYLLSRSDENFPSAQDIEQYTSLTKEDILAILAIHQRTQDDLEIGAEAIQGQARYPGEAVCQVFAFDQV